MYAVTDEMFSAFWDGAYIAVYFLMGAVAWTIVARIINSSLD